LVEIGQLKIRWVGLLDLSMEATFFVFDQQKKNLEVVELLPYPECCSANA
jgi:hypothetical protein